MELGSKDNYAVFTLNTLSEDEFGTASSQVASTIEFWCAVKDARSNRIVDDGKRRNKTTYELMCDSRDVEELTVNHKGTIDGLPQRYVVTDMYEDDFKFHATVIVKSID